MQNSSEFLSYPDFFQAVCEKTRTVKSISLVGLRGGAKAYLSLDLLENLKKPLVVVAESFSRAEEIYQDALFFGGHERVFFFPDWDTAPYDLFSPNPDLMGLRLTALDALLKEDRSTPALVVTTVSALMAGMIPPDVLTTNRFVLSVGEAYPRQAFITRLQSGGYVRVDMVEAVGEFSVRGDIVDLYPITAEHPLRLDFFGDDLESLRFFDVSTQKSFSDLPRFIIPPASEGILTPQTAASARAALPNYKVGMQPELYRQLYRFLEQEAPFPGAEGMMPLLYGKVGWLHEVMAQAGAFLVLDDPEKLMLRAGDFFNEVTAEHMLSREGGNLALDPESLYLTPKAFKGILARFPSLRALSLEEGPDTWICPLADNHSLRHMGPAGTSVHASLSELVKQLVHWRSEGVPIVICARSETGAERLKKLLAEFDLGTALLEAGDLAGHIDNALAGSEEGEPWEVRIASRSPRQGFRVVNSEGETRFALLTEEELLGEKAPQRRLKKSKLQHFIASLGELKEGELVVHVEYGIGRYEGLKRISAGEAEGEFLVLVYSGGDKVYVPVARLNQVQKYTGIDGGGPGLNKLGDGAWAKTKAKTTKVVEEMAEDLVRVQAERKTRKGTAFTDGGGLMTEFEEAFPFQETEDQERAIEEVLADMAEEKPMDRLVCGDVGFGKTEIAMRAAFLAALESKQVLILVPTTILAQQHFETFVKRFEGFPVEIEMLSRFRSPSQQKKIVEDFSQGQVDILIGTHRLLSKDILPKDLGLLVIDEEQRFGVTAKEKIKRLRTQVDVVTLSATPIPRTLHMSLMGVRDLSIINTPPMDRMAVRTRLVKAGDYILREAIEREVRRGGQVFLVHNRVEDIFAYGNYIQGLLPRVKIGVAHGQMGEKQLEEVMMAFVKGELDLLLSTTIIESGLDIPRANTIIINNADRFGLAQLYQLRGRVGRSNVQAFAYLMVSGEKALTEVAQKRLQLLQEFNDLGSGFKIASQDLEIRGAGNLLGSQQSGNVNNVGLELFTQMVEEAVSRLQGEELPPAGGQEIKVDLGFPYLLPEEYIQGTRQRLDLYKQMSEVRTLEEMWAIRQGVEDRFGRPPSEVTNLFSLIEVRLRAAGFGVVGLEKAGQKLQIQFGQPERIDLEALMGLLTKGDSGLKMLPGDKLLLGAMPASPEGVLERLEILNKFMGSAPA